MKPLLLVIDFVNDIVHPDGKIPTVAQFVSENQVIQQANKTITIARQHHIPIVHVKVGFSADYIECPKNSPLFAKTQKLGALQLDSWGADFHVMMDVKKQDRIIVKHRISALYATPLATILTANQIDTVVISGVSTNMAVDTVTRELHDRDYKVIIVKDACAAATKDAHEACLTTLARIATVCNVKNLTEHIKSTD